MVSVEHFHRHWYPIISGEVGSPECSFSKKVASVTEKSAVNLRGNIAIRICLARLPFSLYNCCYFFSFFQFCCSAVSCCLCLCVFCVSLALQFEVAFVKDDEENKCLNTHSNQYEYDELCCSFPGYLKDIEDIILLGRKLSVYL